MLRDDVKICISSLLIMALVCVAGCANNNPSSLSASTPSGSSAGSATAEIAGSTTAATAGSPAGATTTRVFASSPTTATNSAGMRIKGYVWPIEDMGDIPELSGDILDIVADDTGISVDIWGLSEEAVREYISLLIDTGYAGETVEMESGGFMFDGINRNADKARVVYSNTKYTVVTYSAA